MIRAGLRIAGLLVLLAIMAPPHWLWKQVARSPFPRWFLGSAGWTCGARVSVTGEPIAPHTLLLANHVSWLDILVLAGATGTRFVSKAEVRDHPLLRWLADQNHTLYIERSDRGAVLDQARAVADALAGREPLALFPEGTTGDGELLLPFRPSLLAAIAKAPPGTTVRPVAIDYGAMRSLLGWTDGESGKVNAMRLLSRRGSFAVTVRLLAPLDASLDRKALARSARAAIEQALEDAASNGGAPAL